MIVVDTNILCYLHIRGSHSELAERAFRRDPQWISPLLWRSEFRNAIALYLRKGLLTLAECVETCATAETWMAGREMPVDSARVLELAATTGRSAYDCEFAAVAQAYGVRLVSSDNRVVSSFAPVALSLVDFVGAEPVESPTR